MAVKRVIQGVYAVPMGMANVFLIESDDGLTRIDAGYPGKQAAVFGAILGLAVRPINSSTQSFKHAGNLLYILALVLNALTVYAFMLALVRPFSPRDLGKSR